MRNLKRVLSLALASVMLMGMMVVGSSAAFKDDEKIVNDKAVAIAGGFGLFAGDTEGNFNPEGTVTRAQMAAVIAKMFYGSELNADTYKGGNKFTDTASFEGGWAEGYINLGVEKGWFKGYGDGTFKPGQAVTTAEAMTMIINLLGIDAGEGTWPMTVMAAVEEAKLFGDGLDKLPVELKPAPATNVAMTRDQLSVAVVNGMYYSPEDAKCYRISGVDLDFATMADAISYITEYNTRVENEYTKKIAAENDPAKKVQLENALANELMSVKWISPKTEDTLAVKTFDTVVTSGYVVANQATGEKFTQLSNGTKLNLETGLDMLGHWVNAYYKKGEAYQTEKKPGTAYCLVDTADYYTVEAPIFENKKAFLDVFGGKIEEAQGYNLRGYDEATYTAAAGTYAVDKATGKIDNFIAPTYVTVSQVGFVKTVAGKETIKIGNTVYDNMAENDVIVEYEGIAEEDIVVVKEFGFIDYNDGSDEGKVYVEKLEPVTGKVEAMTKGELNGYDVTYATIDGKDYLVSYDVVVPNYTSIDRHAAAVMTASTLKTDGVSVYDAYIYNGVLVGAEQVSGAGKLEDAIFVVDTYMMDVNTGYGTTEHYYVQGINAAGEEVSILVGIDGVKDNDNTNDSKEGYEIKKHTNYTKNTFYNFEKSLDRDQAKKDIMYGKVAQAYTAGMKDTDGFFAEAGIATVTANKLDKEDKYLFMENAAGNIDKTDSATRLFVTDSTKFVVVERPTTGANDAKELKYQSYTGPISKVLNLTANVDDIYVAAMADANGANKTAELVVIVTDKLNLAVEDYVYIAADATYSITADGIKYNNLYFTETEEFKAATLDGTTPYANGFYEITETDEDGVLKLTEVAYSTGLELKDKKALGVYGNSLIIDTANQDMYALADDVKIYDVRSAKKLEKSEVAEITSLKDIAASIKGTDPYEVYFDLLLEEVDSTTKEITHIFVKSIKNDTNGDNVVIEK